jgi:hypothetical protein
MIRHAMLALTAMVLASCDYTEVEREVGYKGKARLNPWLAAERFTKKYDYEALSSHSWTTPEWDDAAWFIPVSAIGNRSFTRQMEEWVTDGGHLVLLIEHASSETNDWGLGGIFPEVEPPIIDWLERAGIRYVEDPSESVKSEKIGFGDMSFKVEAVSGSGVSIIGSEPGVFASQEYGGGRLTVLTDSRIFRNRWIGDHDHAALMLALIEATGNGSRVGFMRGTGLSFWGLLGDHLWPLLIALGAWLVFWLWRNLTRFGPTEAAEVASELRGYGHHLEALGDFQWRLDHATGLLAPLRTQVFERGQRLSARMGRRDDDFFQFLADRAELPRERVFRALAEAAPADSAILTRTTADLQQLLKVLN